VTLGTTTRMIRRDDIRYVQAHGDYARLHTDDGSYLVRIPLNDLNGGGRMPASCASIVPTSWRWRRSVVPGSPPTARASRPAGPSCR
jgi:hypothetical protein